MNEKADAKPKAAPLVKILDERFAAGELPHRWYTDTPNPRYSRGAWDCRAGDGVILPLPHDRWNRLRLEVDLDEVSDAATAYCGGDNRTALSLSLGNDPAARHRAMDGGMVLEQSAVAVLDDSRAVELVCDWTHDSMGASANGRTVITAPNIRRSARAGTFQLGFRGCVVRRIAVFGEPAEPPPPPPTPRRVRDGYPLEVTVDFNDDLMSTAWTRKTFASLFDELKSWGVRRVSWIDLGRESDGYFDCAPHNIDKHGQETFRNVGDIFSTAVETAHSRGIELYGLFKPFDMAIAGITFPPGSELAKRFGRIHRIGGSLGWATRMAADHQDLITARKPSAHGPARCEVWSRIDLVKDDDAPAAITSNDVTFIVSDDNETYHPYTGPMTRREVIEDYPVYHSTPSGPRPTRETRRVRVLRFDGMAIREPYVAVVVNGAGRSFSNRLCGLVHVFGDGREETHFTLGLSPRRIEHAERYRQASIPADAARESAGPPGGFEFNRYPGSPSGAMTSGGDPINTPLALDRGKPAYIAIARGKDRGPLAVMSPSFPQTRALWMTWIEAMLDAGADGIDIRPGHHHSDFAWIEYGFETPVRDEMLRRTGVDIWETDDFDHDLWRRVRGDGWTQFVREVSAVVRGRGKKLALHIDGHFDNPPGAGGAMNMVIDWRCWLTERLCDSVTGKSLWPESSLSRDVLELAHKQGIPVTYAPYCNNFFEHRSSANHLGDSPAGCHVPVDRLIQWGRDAGYDGFVFYECASALRATPDGTVGFRPGAEPLRGVMQRHFVTGNE